MGETCLETFSKTCRLVVFHWNSQFANRFEQFSTCKTSGVSELHA